MSEIKIVLPEEEGSKSLEIAKIKTTTIEDDMAIPEAFKNKNNSLHIIVNATTAGDIVFKAGDNYPNAMLGDCSVNCDIGYTDIIIEDISRFENRDGSISLGKSGDLAGTIFAVAKRSGLKPVV